MLKAAVLAGLIAGTAVSAFHLLLAEPVIDRAIELEAQASRARGEAAEPPAVSRPTQRVGLVVGFLLYGLTWGLVFGVGYRLLGGRLPGGSAARRGWLLAAVAGWSVAMFPFLKYPANPPGVGDPETIWYRQGLYLSFLALSVVGVGLATSLARVVGGRVWPLAAAGYAIYAVALYVAMPVNPEPVPVGADIVWTFRAVSLAGLVLFWAVLGSAFGWLSRESA